MTFVDTSLTALASQITHLSLHTAAPNSSGSNESTAARQSVTLVVSGDELTASNITFTGGANGGPVTHVGFWTALTGGTFVDSMALSPASDDTFNAVGEYVVDSVTLTGAYPA